MPRIKELSHTVIYVSDLGVSRDWYCKNFGMTVVIDSPERKGSFLSFGENDHDIALFENAVAKSEETINHIALKFDGSVQELGEFRKDLIARGVEVHKAVDHGISYGIYFTDPDNHCWEVFVERQCSEATRIDAMRATGVMAEPIDLETVNA